MASGSENKKERLINKLPDEIVLSILSRLSMDQVARAGLVSRKWNYYWHHFRVLNFDNSIAFKTMVSDALKVLEYYPTVIRNGRFDFVNWVNNVLDNHLGFIVDEFKLVFYFNITHQKVIDKWVVWAFSKHVEKFHLDFTPRITFGMADPNKHFYQLDLPILESCNTKFNLTSLCLKCVDVTNQAMECFLNTCAPTLDNLCIHKSNVLTTITAVSLPSLKYFKLYDCPNIQSVNIKAPKLVSFKYFSGWYPVLRLFNIENASMLSHVSINVKDEECFIHILRSLFKYFSHLEYLKLSWLITSTISPVLGNFPVLANLKHLKLFACFSEDRTLDAWVPFIGACPLLQKLTLELRCWFSPVWPKIAIHDKSPLFCLKTFEIKMFNGSNVDLDIANFVLQNAPALEEVVLHICELPLLVALNVKAPLTGVGLTLPRHVKLVVV